MSLRTHLTRYDSPLLRQVAGLVLLLRVNGACGSLPYAVLWHSTALLPSVRSVFEAIVAGDLCLCVREFKRTAQIPHAKSCSIAIRRLKIVRLTNS